MLKKKSQTRLSVRFFGISGCLIHTGMGLNRRGERVRIHFVLWKKRDFVEFFRSQKSRLLSGFKKFKKAHL